MIPASIRAGDTFTDLWSLPDYPASDGWALRLTLISAANRYQSTAAASGADHRITLTASTTAGCVPASYAWTLDATKAAERYTVQTGRIEVLPDLATALTYDTRSPYRKALEQAEAALATYGSKAYLQAIEVGERKQTFSSASDFLAFISKLRFEVQRETNAERLAQGLKPKNKLLVRFRR